MPYTIVDDGDEINIRATITQRWELAELVTKLQQRVDGLPVNLTTYIDAIDETNKNIQSSVSKLSEANDRLGQILSDDYQPDAQDVNRKELSNER